MKKILFSSMVGLSLLFLGCSGKAPQPYKCEIDGKSAPEWVCKGGSNIKDKLVAVGIAEKSPLGIGFQRQEAIAQARDELARQISVKVKNMFKSYLSSTGLKNDQTAERVATSVSKQIASLTLRNSKLIDTWVSPKGTMYVLVGIDKNLLKESIKTTYKNNKALWQEFKAKKAQEELDAQIDKEFQE